MKRMIAAAMTATAVCIVLAGCMSDREFILRQNDIDAKKDWKPTYQILSIKGPLNVPEGGELVINAPSQPFVHTIVPRKQYFGGKCKYRHQARCTTLSAYDAIAYSEYGISTIGTQQDTRHEVQQTS